MKIATKITAGYGVLITVMVGVLIYQVTLIHQVQSITDGLARISFHPEYLALRLRDDIDQVLEFTRKLYATGDVIYMEALQERREVVGSDLERVKALHLPERRRVEAMEVAWTDFLRLAEEQESLFPDLDAEGLQLSLQLQLTALEGLRAETLQLINLTRAAIEERVEEASAAANQVETISWAAAILALLLALVVSLMIVRSISHPLRHLTQATQALAYGRFSYRLNLPGNDELSQLAKDFNSMARRLNELDQMKKDFVSHVSHELKAPLASMQETTRLLLEEIPGSLTEKQRKLLNLNLQSGNRLFAMIRNLLDLSRMEAGVLHYDFRRLDITEVVRTALTEFEMQLREKNIRIESQFPDHPVMVNCDEDRMIQVVENLLGNALKFSPSNRTIGICVRSTLELPEKLPAKWRSRINGDRYGLLTVADNGPGVADEQKERIFEKFHQTRHGRKMSGEGVGLGLAICQTIVEAHNGAIWVEDGPSSGSLFQVLLPLSTGNADLQPPAAPIVAERQ
jgi:two-component system, NtrC family, sensor histidine kinase GlrK